jgi:hypothetical protein
MTDLRTAAQQALEALEALDAPPSGVVDHYELDRRKQALKAALEQPEQAEPVAWRWVSSKVLNFYGSIPRAICQSPHRHRTGGGEGMPREQIIRMAREAGWGVRCFDGIDEVMDGDAYHIQTDEVERFAALAYAAGAAQERKNYEHTLALQQQSYEREIQIEVEAEREACAKVCESLFDLDDDSCSEAEQCAAAIRARGNT